LSDPSLGARVLVPTDPAAVAVARRYAAEVCQGLEPQLSADVTLVVSELVTNAIRYGAAPVRLCVVPTTGDGASMVRIEVSDANPAFTGPARDPTVTATGHRGLLLVDQLCRRWGCDTVAHGKRVWCEI
jgi:anti-sigma regulatory factor (Ser/Thr protein kinase)